MPRPSRREAPPPPSREQFGGHFVDEYRRGAQVSLNVGGEWQLATLTADARVENGKLHLETNLNAGGKQNFSEKEATSIELVQLNRGLDDEQQEEGHTYDIGQPGLDNRGRVVYEVVDRNTNEIFHDVPQELLLTWQEAKGLEKRVQDLYNDIVIRVRQPARVEALQEERRKVELVLNEIFTGLPKHSEMSTNDRTAVKKIRERFSELQEEAEKLLKDFEKAVRDAMPTVPPGTPPAWTEHKRTAADIELEKKEHAARAAWAKNLEEGIRDEVEHDPQLKQRVDAAEKAALTEAQKKADDEFADAEKEYDAEKKKHDDWVAQKPPKYKKGDPHPLGDEPTVPPKPKKRKIDKVPEDRRQQILKDVSTDEYFERYQNLTGDFGDALKRTVDERRRKEAADAKMAGLSPQKLNAGGTDFTGPAFARKTVEMLQKVLHEWQTEEFKPTEKAPARGAEVFDFEKQSEVFFAEVKALEDEIKAKASDATKGDPKQFLDELMVLADVSKDAEDELKTLADFRKTKGNPALKISDLEKTREAWAVGNRQNLDGIREKWQKWLGKEKRKEVDEAVNKEFAEKSKTAVELKKESIIDIPEARLRELLFQNRVRETKAAMRALYEGILQREGEAFAAGDVKTNAVDAFREIFAATAPVPTVLRELRRYGITNWSEFKKLWDETLAEVALRVMGEHAEASIKKKVSERVTGWEQAKKLKWQIIARVGVSVGLLGAAGLATAGIAGAVGVGAVLAGGGVAGGIRAWINKKLFGSERMKERTNELLKELETEKRTELIDELLDEQFGAGNGDYHAATMRPDGTANIEGLPSFSAVVAQTLREITTERVKAEEGEPEEVKRLTGNARAMYEDALAHLEVKEPDDAVKIQLAKAIERLNERGNRITAQTIQEVANKNPAVIRVLEGFATAYSGRAKGTEGTLAAVGTGVMVNGAFLLESGPARAALGAIFGSVAGYKEGMARFQSREARVAREGVLERMRLVKFFTEELQNRRALSDSARRDFRTGLLALKRLLHGNTSIEELTVFVTVAKSGEMHPDKLLFKQIQGMVYDAERTGILFEKAEARANMNTVLEAMKAHGDAVEEAHKETLATQWGRSAKKRLAQAGSVAAGALAGAGAALAMGYVMRPVADFAGERIRSVVPGLNETISKLTAVVNEETTSEAATETASGIGGEELMDYPKSLEGEPSADLAPAAEVRGAGGVGPEHLIQRGEGFTNPIIRDLEAHPERFAQRANDIPEFKKILADHPDGKGLSPEELKRAAGLLYKHDIYGNGDVRIDKGGIGKVVVASDATGHYRVGTTDGSRVEDHLYTEKGTAPLPKEAKWSSYSDEMRGVVKENPKIANDVLDEKELAKFQALAERKYPIMDQETIDHGVKVRDSIAAHSYARDLWQNRWESAPEGSQEEALCRAQWLKHEQWLQNQRASIDAGSDELLKTLQFPEPGHYDSMIAEINDTDAGQALDEEIGQILQPQEPTVTHEPFKGEFPVEAKMSSIVNVAKGGGEATVTADASAGEVKAAVAGEIEGPPAPKSKPELVGVRKDMDGATGEEIPAVDQDKVTLPESGVRALVEDTIEKIKIRFEQTPIIAPKGAGQEYVASLGESVKIKLDDLLRGESGAYSSELNRIMPEDSGLMSQADVAKGLGGVLEKVLHPDERLLLTDMMGKERFTIPGSSGFKFTHGGQEYMYAVDPTVHKDVTFSMDGDQIVGHKGSRVVTVDIDFKGNKPVINLHGLLK